MIPSAAPITAAHAATAATNTHHPTALDVPRSALRIKTGAATRRKIVEIRPADARLLNDKLVPASTNWRGQYSDQLLETIDHCLKLNYMERPQSVFSLQKVLMDRSALEPKRGSLLGSIKRTLGKDLF